MPGNHTDAFHCITPDPEIRLLQLNKQVLECCLLAICHLHSDALPSQMDPTLLMLFGDAQ